ncbi:MAG: OmpA family protein, partial [Candidatus Krumholzibacteria bacterium]|nr:OmpA family protein [Candidatus Krumholzibacteria bacterium]
MTGRLPGRGVFAFFPALLLLAALSCGAAAQTPPAGMVISSTSVASYDIGEGRCSVNSNTIRFSVLPVYGPLVLPDGTVDAPAAARAAFSGEAVYFGYALTNTGNAPDTFALRALTVAPSQFVPASTVYLDEDGDGEVDPGERAITGAGPVGQGETVRLVLAAVLPEGLLGGETAHLDLEARSTGDTSLVDRGNIVRVVARSAARVDLTLSADVPEVRPGGEIAWTILYENTGELTATDVVVTDYIDFDGMMDGTEFIAGSAVSSIPGIIEYYDIDRALWTDVAPPPARVKGARLRLDDLAPGGAGTFSFRVRVDADHAWGEIRDEAAADWIGADDLPYRAVSNEATVTVGRLSMVLMGPAGNPGAPAGTAEDRVLVILSAADSSCLFLHEVRNDGNFADTFHVALADSALIPADWAVSFTDSAGVPLPMRSSYSARLGPIERGGSRRVCLRIEASARGLRGFDGREIAFDAEAYSLVDPGARDAVGNVLVKDDMPLLSIDQSIRERNAMVGDVLSFIVAVENLTAETRVDSVEVLERLPSGLSFAGGDGGPSVSGNTVRWEIGSLDPGERREIVMRARVAAGQERDELVAVARVAGVTAYGERASGGPAYASVRLVEGEFTRRGILFGSAFIDEDGDGLRSGSERGVVGARIFYEKGTYAVSDSAGLWSIPGVDEGTHVVRIDPKSLPDSLVPAAAGHFGLRVPGQYLIDLAPSGDRRVDFPLRRRIAPAGGSAFAALEGDSTAVARGGRDGARAPERQGGDAAGTGDSTASDDDVSTKDVSVTFEALILPSTLFAAGSCDLEEIPLREVAALSLWLREHPGWTISIEGHSDDTPISTAEYPSNFELSVARARSVFQLLRMNGIPAERMDFTGYGDRRPITDNSTEAGRARNRRVEVRAVPPEGYGGEDPMIPAILAAPDTTAPRKYMLADSAGICADIVRPDEGSIFADRDGIDVEILAPLASSVELYVNNVPVGREKIGRKQIDVRNGTIGYVFYGVKIAPGLNNILVVCRSAGERNVCVRHVYLAGPPAVMVAERDPVEAQADGAARPEITFLVSDESGLPVRDGFFVTVTGPEDLLAGADVNPQMNGVQVATEGGRAAVTLASSPRSRRETVRAELGKLRAECLLEYVSPMRDWFLLGYGEGDVGYSSLTGSGDTRRTYEKQRDGLYAEGKVALYGQGEIGSGRLLTVAVDTRPTVEDKLRDRIEPEQYYPVYGDAGELRLNASSRRGTYL